MRPNWRQIDQLPWSALGCVHMSVATAAAFERAVPPMLLFGMEAGARLISTFALARVPQLVMRRLCSICETPLYAITLCIQTAKPFAVSV